MEINNNKFFFIYFQCTFDVFSLKLNKTYLYLVLLLFNNVPLLLILLNFAPLPLLALLVPCDMSPVDDYLISVPLEVDIIN